MFSVKHESINLIAIGRHGISFSIGTSKVGSVHFYPQLKMHHLMLQLATFPQVLLGFNCIDSKKLICLFIQRQQLGLDSFMTIVVLMLRLMSATSFKTVGIGTHLPMHCFYNEWMYFK